ncbi:hypothetical protein [Woodsholea maritima]|uniref:hypothetical protein n=1 Tax=Woodsholea maritima TaxID=240237 RepID=UPI00037A441F|nr:hypothetical protein [Woodsholea maritima]
MAEIGTLLWVRIVQVALGLIAALGSYYLCRMAAMSPDWAVIVGAIAGGFVLGRIMGRPYPPYKKR